MEEFRIKYCWMKGGECTEVCPFKVGKCLHPLYPDNYNKAVK